LATSSTSVSRAASGCAGLRDRRHSDSSPGMRPAFWPGTSRYTWHCRVLDPCWLLATGQGVYLRKLRVAPVSPRSTRAPTRSSGWSWPASCWS